MFSVYYTVISNTVHLLSYLFVTIILKILKKFLKYSLLGAYLVKT